MEKGGTQTQFLDATNRFYTLVPHDFGMKKPPLLDTAEIVKVNYFFMQQICGMNKYSEIGNYCSFAMPIAYGERVLADLLCESNGIYMFSCELFVLLS